MKNLKKVLAMVLAFACTFTMFAGAKVFEDVPAGSDYSEAITMLSDLGIIQGKDDGKYHPEDTITRAEACAMIARMMTGDPNVSQYVGAQNFTDVAKGSWKDSAIGYCYINNIVIGVGNNKFEPDRAITDAEFITMVVRAMGYETPDMAQGYPYTYMSNAQAIGLLDGVNMVANTDALRGEDAQVIYNALFADYARGAKLVNTTHGTSVETYPTLAESVWGLERAAVGTWDKDDKDDETAELTNCKAHTWVVIGSDPAEEGNILAYPIDDDTTDLYETDKNDVDGNAKTGYHTYSFKYDGDIEAIKGYQVELWGQGSHGEPTWEKSDNKVVYSEDWEIKAIKTVKGQSEYDYNASMADSKDHNGTIELDDVSLDLESVADNADHADYTAQNPEIVTFLGGELNTISIKDDESVEDALNVRNGAQYKLVDWDSDGDVDWIVVDQANYYKVESVNSKRLTVSSMKAKKDMKSDQEDESKTWKLDDLEKIGTNAADKDVKIKYEVPDDLEEGDVIEVTYKIAYDKGEKAQVITATATKVEADTAELDKVSTKDDLELTFDGEVSKIAQNANKGDVIDPANPDKYEDFDDEELGTEFSLWKDRNGFIVYSDYATENSNYMMILDTADGSDKTGDRKLAQADILLADNSVKKDVEFASDLKIDGENNGDTGYYKDDKGSYDARSWNEAMVVGNVYKFWQDEDGVITKMESLIDVDDAEQDDDYSYDESADRLKDSDGGYVASLEDAKVIFAVTKDYITEDSSDFEVDADNVMAVKQADIPEIVKSNTVNTNDTKAEQLVNAGGTGATTNSWLGNSDAKFIADVDKNGEASAAILGVENFNKFNDAATKIGLVTSVSYDKNDVVEVEVAVNGEVTTIKSAEDVDFDDIVEQYNGSSDDGLSTKEAADMLKNNAAYAEITTNADGVLTNVTFLHQQSANHYVGHYYEVSRRIITDVKDGNVAYGNTNAYFYSDKSLYSVGRLPVDDADIDDDVTYYTIDGRPTTHNDTYDNVLLSIANGFDGTPDITAESDSSLIESYVNDKFDDADTYQVADLARKIDGDIVAAFAFDDTLGEVDKTGGATVDKVSNADVRNDNNATKIADVARVAGGGKVSADVKVYNADGKTEATGITATLTSGELKVTASASAAAGNYVAKFSVDGKEYTVDFTVKAADVAVPTFTETHKDGADQVDEVKASIEIDLAADSGVTASQDLDVQINGVDVVATSSTNTTDAYATALATAINDSTLGFDVKASASASKVTVTANDDTVKAFTVKAKTGATGIAVTTANAKEYSAEVAVTNAVAELTITSGVNVDSTITVTVGDASANITLAAGDTAEQIAAKVAAAPFTGYTVTADGAKVTFTSTATGDSATISDVTVAAKA